MPEIITIAVSGLAVTVSVVSLFIFLANNRQSRERLDQQEAAEMGKVVNESHQILEEAMHKAQAIIDETKTEQLKLVDSTTAITRDFEKSAEKQFLAQSATTTTQYEQEVKNLTEQVKKAHDQYLTYLGTLRDQLSVSHEDTLQLVKQEINTLFEGFEQNLSDFLQQTEQKTVSSIDLEIKSARELIDTYKQQQLKIIDENAVAILEKTLSIVLSKKLTLNDQMDLVYQALEKAKAEKFII